MTDENQEWPTEQDMVAYLMSLPADAQAKLANIMETWKTEMLAATDHEQAELLFCGADGEKVIKCLHYRADVLGGEEGPILLPSSNPKVVVGAVSDELIIRKVAEYNELYPDPLTRERRWEMYLNSLAVRIAELDYETRGWDEFDELVEQANGVNPGRFDQWPYDQDRED